MTSSNVGSNTLAPCNFVLCCLGVIIPFYCSLSLAVSEVSQLVLYLVFEFPLASCEVHYGSESPAFEAGLFDFFHGFHLLLSL